MSATEGPCSTCDLLRDLLAQAQAQNKLLLDHLVNLADPLALQRLTRATSPASIPTGEPRKPPVTSPAMLRLKNPDRPSDEDLAAYKLSQAEPPPDTTQTRDAIERSFEKVS